MTDPKLLELRRKAEAATQGPWADEDSDCVITTVEQDNPNNPFPVVACTSALCIGDDRHFANGEFIAAANPATVVSLLDRLKDAEEVVRFYSDPKNFSGVYRDEQGEIISETDDIDGDITEHPKGECQQEFGMTALAHFEKWEAK